jgi:hypothetical protein
MRFAGSLYDKLEGEQKNDRSKIARGLISPHHTFIAVTCFFKERAKSISSEINFLYLFKYLA